MRLLPEYRTRAPFELGCRPSPERNTPDFTPSSTNAPMAPRNFSSGSTPASVSLSALSRPMNRIVPGFRAGGASRNCCSFSRQPSGFSAGSTGKSGSSNSGRTSTSPSWKGILLAHSTASSFDFAWISQKPAIKSFASAKGPSVTLSLPLA